MENGIKMRISRIFRSSLGSCRSKDISDVVERGRERPPIFVASDNHHHHHRQRQLIELFSPKPPPPPPFSSVRSRLKCPQTDQNNKSPLLLTHVEGQMCPPATPVSPFLNTYYYDDYHHDAYFHNCPASSSSSKAKGKVKKTKKHRRVRSRIKTFGLHDEFPACSYNGLFSSDEDDDDKTTLFSSRSLSSDSSDQSLSRSKSCRMVQRANPNNHHPRPKRGAKDDSGIMGAHSTMLQGLMEGKVKDSFAVVKRSSDPYNDFRTSMVEMIVERQIFSGDELEKLLQCFLSLNCYHHHRVIVEVFTEIWEALFSNGS